MPALKLRNISFPLKIPVTSFLPHGSILGPVLLNNFIHYIVGLVSEQGTMFSNWKKADLVVSGETQEHTAQSPCG